MIYEYECQCGHGIFEIWAKISDPPLQICPQCEEEKIQDPQPPKRLISISTFVLQGSGWAKDKYSK